MLLIKNIGRLLGVQPREVVCLRGADLDRLDSIENAWLLVDDEGLIASFGRMDTCPDCQGETYDADGRMVSPAFVDSHTHLVYAGSREGEFLDKINGLSYSEIAARGGGILNSAARLNATSEDELFGQSAARLRQVASMGTCAIEIKSGYALTLEGELKMLRVIRRLADAFPEMIIKSTFLGAHAVPLQYKSDPEKYVDHIINDMLPAVAAENLADFVDAFCEIGFFTPEQTLRIFEAARAYGLTPRLHADQLHCCRGSETAIAANAISADHLESIGEEQVQLLAASDVICTALPGASFFLSEPYAPARAMVKAGCAVAIASDYNPGTSPSGSMKFVWSLGCIKLRLTPAEAFNAITVNTAAALGISDKCGSITPGKYASLIFYDRSVPSLEYIPYAYTQDTIERAMLKGVWK